MKCNYGRYLTNELIKATRQQDHHAIMKYTRECMEHNDRCAVCSGVEAPNPLADQLFRTRVQVGKDVKHG